MPKGIDLQLTREQAIELAESGKRKEWNPKELVQRQLFTRRMFVPSFGIFHGAVEEVLGHPVWTHEFANPEHLRKEFEELE